MARIIGIIGRNKETAKRIGWLLLQIESRPIDRDNKRVNTDIVINYYSSQTVT